ncbi:MAG: hypothetical protein SPI59_00280 [Finegoldia sp.]|nr:hypothetical protein [Finegoldia sp.]
MNNIKRAQLAFTMSNVLIVLFINFFMKGNRIGSLFVLLAYIVYNYQKGILVIRSEKFKRSKFYLASNLILFICFILMFYHPNKFLIILTYLSFIAYNTSLWVAALKYRNE